MCPNALFHTSWALYVGRRSGVFVWWIRWHRRSVHVDINPWGYLWHPISLATDRENSVNTVVNHVGFCESFYTVLESTMPMFGSTTGGKSGAASAPEKDDEAASKGAKAKEDTDCGAACSDHHQSESMSRETSPQWSPSNLHTRERFTLLFGIEVAPTIEDGIGSHILPAYAWSECIVFDMLSPTIEDISQVVILNPMECLVFRGHHSKGEGFTYSEALALSDAYHWETTTWIGHRVHCTRCQRRS